MRKVHAVAVTLVLTTGAANALAADLLVPKKFKTIAAASDAAKPGDRIVVRGNLRGAQTLAASDVALDLRKAHLKGTLTVSGDRVSVQGGDLRAGVILSGDDATLKSAKVRGVAYESDLISSGATVRVTGDDATLDGLQIKASHDYDASPAVETTGARTEITAADVPFGLLLLSGDAPTVSGSKLDTVAVYGNDAQILGNSVRSDVGMSAVYVEADGAVVSKNDVKNGGVICFGAGTVVEDNSVSSINIASVMVAGGDSPASVTGNRLNACGARAIDASGAECVVQSNEIRSENGDTSIVVRGDSATVLDNSIVRTSGQNGGWGFAGGVEVHGDGVSVENNDVVDGQVASSMGVFVDGIGNYVGGNDVRGGGTGVTVCGCNNAVTSNAVHDVLRDGLVVSGEGSSVTDAVVSNAGDSGILVFDPIAVSGSNVTEAGLGGVVSLSSGSCALGRCEFANNAPADVISNGTVTVTGPTNANVVTTLTQYPELVSRQQWGPMPIMEFNPFVFGGD